MKKLLILFMFVTGMIEAQVNNTSNNRYTWNRKGTEPAPGYVVLKSGKKMEGTIQLKGDPDKVKMIVLVKEGKEIEFEPASLSAYGLNVGELVNDSPEEMYEWGAVQTQTVMGKEKTKQSTKSRRGYVILNDGKRIDGQLHLNKFQGVFEEIVIKNDAEGKQVFECSKVSHFGLVPTISEMTKGGKKVFDDVGRNFSKGSVVKNDGSKVEGLIAFMRSSDIPQSDAVLYQTIYYGVNDEDALQIIPNAELKEVTQTTTVGVIEYVKYKEGFVEKSKIGTLNILEQYKLFQPGKIVLNDNTTQSGEVAQIIADGEKVSKSIKFKGSDGVEKQYTFEEIQSFDQKLSGADKTFSAVDIGFVPVIFTGTTFLCYKNPFPTSINKLATSVARSAISAAGNIATDKMVDKGEGTKEEKAATKEAIHGLSSEQLMDAANALENGKKINLTKEGNKELTKMELALVTEAIAKEAAKRLVIFNPEICMYNKKSKERTVIVKNDYSDTMEPVLKSCESYLTMSKDEQKKCRNIDQMESTFKMIDACYSN